MMSCSQSCGIFENHEPNGIYREIYGDWALCVTGLSSERDYQCFINLTQPHDGLHSLVDSLAKWRILTAIQVSVDKTN